MAAIQLLTLIQTKKFHTENVTKCVNFKLSFILPNHLSKRSRNKHMQTRSKKNYPRPVLNWADTADIIPFWRKAAPVYVKIDAFPSDCFHKCMKTGA